MLGLRRFIVVTADDYDRALVDSTFEMPQYHSSCLQCIAGSMQEGQGYRVIDMAVPGVEAFRGSRTGNHVLLLGVEKRGVAWDVRIQIDETHQGKQTANHQDLTADAAVAAAESILSNFRAGGRD